MNRFGPSFGAVSFLIFLAVISPWPGMMPAGPAYAGAGQPPSAAEEKETEPAPGLGSREVPRQDGGKDKVYYSITTPEEERKAREEEREKEEKSWDVLRNIIIDPRNIRNR